MKIFEAVFNPSASTSFFWIGNYEDDELEEQWCLQSKNVRDWKYVLRRMKNIPLRIDIKRTERMIHILYGLQLIEEVEC